MIIRNRQGGITLIEVLIAVLILAIGLLGVAGVQVVSMQNTVNSDLRTQATLFAQDLAEQIRANGNTLPDNATVTQWTNRVTGNLGSSATVDVDQSGNVFEIQINWRERDSTESGDEDGVGAGLSEQTFLYRLEV
ncbi:type IV pilus modification protein PilV [Marinobacter shengliensis]|uniref:type IV pilus modification protein PilV n=1 Tax=Marinobacter shengliensis TaxID=1389223 RepID=UPI0035BA00F7